MKKKAFTRFLCTSLSALACTAALAVTLSLTDLEQSANGKTADEETTTGIPSDEEKNDGNSPQNISVEPSIGPLNDWKPEKENVD